MPRAWMPGSGIATIRGTLNFANAATMHPSLSSKRQTLKVILKSREPETSLLIKSLAARARGNLGVAHALWRSSLRICDPESDGDEPTMESSRSTLWVVSPSDLELPKLANGRGPLHRFILHGILLHAGLSVATLDTLLPFSREDICRRMSELRTAGFVHEQNGLFQVLLAAYPEVRQDLCGEGFLVDAF